MKNYLFSYSNKNTWQELKGEFEIEYALACQKALKTRRGFFMQLKEDKTSAQLRGFHRLLRLIADHISNQSAVNCDLEMAKQYIKRQYQYYDMIDGMCICRSCKNATIEDMKGLIKTAEIFGAENGINNCFLTSYEEQELINYYNKK